MKNQKKWERDCLEMSPGVNLYTLSGVTVFIANKTVDFLKGQHSHNEYEFTMPLNQDVIACSDDKTIIMERQKLTPFNSGQNHGVPSDIKVDRIICLSCTKEYLDSLSMSGFGRDSVSFENTSFEVSNNIRFLLGMFIEESISKRNGYKIMQDHLAGMIFTELIRCSKNNVIPAGVNNGAEIRNEKVAINRAIDYLREQYSTAFSIEDAASVAGLSPFYFIRTFKAYTGKTPYCFYIDARIERAKELLKSNQANVTEVALACGFSNPGHFSTVFKRKTGVSPTEFKKTIC